MRKLLKQVGVSISSNPHFSLVEQGRYDQEHIRRGITRVKQRLAAWRQHLRLPGRCGRPLLSLWAQRPAGGRGLLCHTAHMAAPSEIEAAFDFVTCNTAHALRLTGYRLEPCCQADINVLAAPSLREVLCPQQPPRWVLGAGKVLACNQVVSTLAQ